MHEYRVAVYPGDGIGPEVLVAATAVLERTAQLDGGFCLNLAQFDWGQANWRRTGRVVPDDFLQALRRHDAIFLGAVGWPAELPDGETLAPLVRIRQAFDQYVCLRPVRCWPGVPAVLTSPAAQQLDLVVLRENSEGEYVDAGGRFRRGTADEVALQIGFHTRTGVERVLRFGFELARQRRRQLTMATKSNALRHGFGLWDEMLEQLQPEFPDVEAHRQHADAVAMDLVRRPERFDVLVASNLFGDLLTDLSGIVGGGLGLAPSCNLNPQRQFPSMFEPVHGSAPDIAGQGVANPLAAVLSGAWMLEWLGQPAAAQRVRNAVAATLAVGIATPDIGGRAGTQQVARALLERLE